MSTSTSSVGGDLERIDRDPIRYRRLADAIQCGGAE